MPYSWLDRYTSVSSRLACSWNAWAMAPISFCVGKRGKRALGDAGLRQVEAAVYAGELSRAAADVHHGARFQALVELCAKVAEVRLFLVREDGDAHPDPLLDFRGCLVRVRAVAQHGGGENVDAVAVEVRSPAQMRVDGLDGALHAFFGHGTFLHVGGKMLRRMVFEPKSMMP